MLSHIRERNFDTGIGNNLIFTSAVLEHYMKILEHIENFSVGILDFFNRCTEFLQIF